MLHIVDGYNVTRSDDATRRLPLAEQRERLVARLRSRGRDLLGDGRVVVVFDGDVEAHGALGMEDTWPVEVRFSRDERADDLIVRLASAAQEAVTLVSSDRELGERVRAHAPKGADVRRCSSLWESASSPAARGRRPRGRGSGLAATVGLPPGANLITEELKRHWLTQAGDSLGGGDEAGCDDGAERGAKRGAKNGAKRGAERGADGDEFLGDNRKD